MTEKPGLTRTNRQLAGKAIAAVVLSGLVILIVLFFVVLALLLVNEIRDLL